MRNERRHGIDESCRGGVDRVQSNHAIVDGILDFRNDGRAELIV